ncbi:hypothetical protein [Achromobacter mucicolens]|uniref:hypothetical protein n=1 Tax=Achromobacter mucicolens TaxID=1389922 RepID=UPI0028ADFE12|nr:hypothetical protein [Achromobacter mucicolens]
MHELNLVRKSLHGKKQKSCEKRGMDSRWKGIAWRENHAASRGRLMQKSIKSTACAGAIVNG